MAKRPQVGVMGSAFFAPRPPVNTSLESYTEARMCRIGGGYPEAMKQVIGNALRPKLRKAN